MRLAILFIFIATGLSAQTETHIAIANDALNEFLNVRDFCISKKGDEAFFTIQSPNQELSQIAFMTKENDQWSAPELLPFCDAFMYMEPFLSHDNNRLYFASDRPLSETTSVKKDFDIWYVDRDVSSNTWSAPKNMGAPVNSELDEFYPSVSKNNNVYFTMVSPEGLGKDDIYMSIWQDGNYSDPSILSEAINTSSYEFNAFVSENEDFIIFSRYKEPGGLGSGDLYISIKDNYGQWETATNLESPINTKYMEYCPFYDEHTKTLYFTSRRNNITPKSFNSLSDFNNYIKKSKNGLSKIYSTPYIIKK